MSNPVPVRPKPMAAHTGRLGPFSKVQNEIIEQHLAEWHEYAFVKHPDAGGRGIAGKLTKWKQERAQKIMKDPAFAESEYPEGFDYKQAFDTIVRKFTNYRNSRKILNGRIRSAEIDAIKDAANFLEEMKMPYSKGWDLFKQRNEYAIEARKAEVLLSGNVSSDTAAYRRALKEKWDETDKESWEARAQNSGGTDTIYNNQKRFAPALLTGLRGLAQGGAFGKMEVMAFYAYRDKTGRVISSCLEAHHDDNVDHFSTHPNFNAELEGFHREFETWADKVLPEEKKLEPIHLDSVGVTITRTSSGLPLFPKLNLDDLAPVSLRKILTSYFEHTWEHTHPGDHDIPWDAIAANPSEYYDVKLYTFSWPIDHPLTLSFGRIYDLEARLSQFSQPFEFKAPGGRTTMEIDIPLFESDSESSRVTNASLGPEVIDVDEL